MIASTLPRCITKSAAWSHRVRLAVRRGGSGRRWASSGPYYSHRERAALAWADAVTRVSDDHVPDAVYDDARAQFNEKELADLTLAIAAISCVKPLIHCSETHARHLPASAC